MIPTRRPYLKVCFIIVVFTLFVGVLVAMNWTGTTTRRSVSVIDESVKTAATDLLHTSSRTSEDYHPLTTRNVNEVEKFLFFTGYPRSGHSIVGSLIDAHPNIILSTGYFLFRQLADTEHAPHSKRALLEQIHKKSFSYSTISSVKTRKGYTMDIPGGMSGKFKKLKVIGDKSAKATATAYKNYQSEFKRLYEKLQSLVNIPLLVIHVVRNPFDMIATQTLYLVGMRESGVRAKANYTEENKLDDLEALKKVTKLYFDLAHAVLEMVPLCNMTVLEIHNEDLVRNPAATVTRMCEFMGVDCSSRYLDACVKKVFPEVSRTRDRVKWSSSLRRWIEEEMLKYPFFHRYSFDS